MTLSLPPCDHTLLSPQLPCVFFSPSCTALIPSHGARARNEDKGSVTAESIVPFVFQGDGYREQTLAEQARLETLLA